jgi:hypothetical protein
VHRPEATQPWPRLEIIPAVLLLAGAVLPFMFLAVSDLAVAGASARSVSLADVLGRGTGPVEFGLIVAGGATAGACSLYRTVRPRPGIWSGWLNLLGFAAFTVGVALLLNAWLEYPSEPAVTEFMKHGRSPGVGAVVDILAGASGCVVGVATLVRSNRPIVAGVEVNSEK